MQLPRMLLLTAPVVIGSLPYASVHAQSPTVAPTIRLAPPPNSSSDQGTADATADSATNLAKKLQNPVGDLISVPFQNNTNFNVGPNKGTQDILNIQPVVPIHM